MERDRTMLYVGTSSDQDVYLLRHLPFDARNRFGHANWRVCKILAHERTPAYFTVGHTPSTLSLWRQKLMALPLVQSYPNELLDASTGIYNVERVNMVVSAYQKPLLDLYYMYVHPSLPIMGSRERLEAAVAAGSVPASLLGAIYCSALSFWPFSPRLVGQTPFDDEWLREDIFKSVLQEAKTPSLATIQAMLLNMQLPPQHVREPNHPGFWPLTNQVNLRRSISAQDLIPLRLKVL